MSSKNDVKLEIRHLRLLTAVAEEGSVTRAGRRLHLTQSALSHQLRDAEEKLGTPLFLRLGRKMLLTPAGEQMLGSARRVLAELHAAEAQVGDLNGGASGVIRLSTECYTCYHWLPPVLTTFQAKFPRVEINIVLEATSRPIAALLEGKLDLAVTSRTARHKNLLLTPTCEDEMVVVMSPKHRLAAAAHVQPRDLAGETIFCYPPKETCTLQLKVLRPAGVEPKRVLEIPLTESMVDMAEAGLGVAFLARWAVASYVSAGKIVTRPLNKGGFRRKWFAATLRSRPTPPYLTEFITLLARTCALDSVRPA
jgi:LysR family transcriptional regulator for metE and metH